MFLISRLYIAVSMKDALVNTLCNRLEKFQINVLFYRLADQCHAFQYSFLSQFVAHQTKIRSSTSETQSKLQPSVTSTC